MDCEFEVETFQRQALEIVEPGADFNPASLPQSGEEYLTHMLYERKRCPAVVVRRPKTVNVEVNSELQSTELTVSSVFTERHTQITPISLLPTIEWKEVQVADFLATRDRINFMRQELLAHNYSEALEPPLSTDATEWLNFCRQHEPLLSIILHLNQRTLEQLLELLSNWLSGEEVLAAEDVQESGEPCSNLSSASLTDTAVAVGDENEGADCLSTNIDIACSEQWLGSWLYAVLSCLHLPIEPSVHGTLREIARSCMRLRSRIQPQELEKAVPYNLFIHLIAKVFDQLDFAEFV